jgi:3-deoxy-D-manno-octulosonic-acid transferase
MRHLYSLLLTVVAVLLLPWVLYRSLVRKRSIGNLRERLGLRPFQAPGRGGAAGERPEIPGQRTVWLHAVSVGEVRAARPLCRQLRQEDPALRLVVTTTTETGQKMARQGIPEADLVGYFPLDWAGSVRRVLRMVRPSLVILMESELWYNFLVECENRHIPVLVANGRISDRTYRRTRRFRRWTGQLYGRVTLFAMQSAADRDRVVSLGAPVERVHVTGNLKYDPVGQEAAIVEAHAEDSSPLGQFLSCGDVDAGRRPMIVAGSTHPGEEAILLDAYQQLRTRLSALSQEKSIPRLLIAPRHPECFAEVARLMARTGLSLRRRSESQMGDADPDLLLLDSIGELAEAYRWGTLVLIGGSLVPIGGHNLLEPARLSRPVIVGPHMENFREIVEVFRRERAVIQLTKGDPTELATTWERLLLDAEEARLLGQQAREVVEANRGATARTVALGMSLLGASRPAESTFDRGSAR